MDARVKVIEQALRVQRPAGAGDGYEYSQRLALNGQTMGVQSGLGKRAFGRIASERRKEAGLRTSDNTGLSQRLSCAQ